MIAAATFQQQVLLRAAHCVIAVKTYPNNMSVSLLISTGAVTKRSCDKGMHWYQSAAWSSAGLVNWPPCQQRHAQQKRFACTQACTCSCSNHSLKPAECEVLLHTFVADVRKTIQFCICVLSPQKCVIYHTADTGCKMLNPHRRSTATSQQAKTCSHRTQVSRLPHKPH